jgi:catechol 2,3-dioxygenase-like lactoylglutathione lyase family enzyme
MSLSKHRPGAPLHIFETVLYADDLAAAARFYGEILGLELVQASDLFLTFRLANSVLLVFDPRLSAEFGRSVPSHGMHGDGHIAFSATDSELEAWKTTFIAAGVAIEQTQAWPEGGRSLYVRDPAGNSVEFAPDTLWAQDNS